MAKARQWAKTTQRIDVASTDFSQGSTPKIQYLVCNSAVQFISEKIVLRGKNYLINKNPVNLAFAELPNL